MISRDELFRKQLTSVLKEEIKVWDKPNNPELKAKITSYLKLGVKAADLLSYAIETANIDIIKFLLKIGTDLNNVTYGETTTHSLIQTIWGYKPSHVFKVFDTCKKYLPTLSKSVLAMLACNLIYRECPPELLPKKIGLIRNFIKLGADLTIKRSDFFESKLNREGTPTLTGYSCPVNFIQFLFANKLEVLVPDFLNAMNDDYMLDLSNCSELIKSNKKDLIDMYLDKLTGIITKRAASEDPAQRLNTTQLCKIIAGLLREFSPLKKRPENKSDELIKLCFSLCNDTPAILTYNEYTYTLLHMAMELEQLPFISYLLRLGADITALNSQKKSPWNLSASDKANNIYIRTLADMMTQHTPTVACVFLNKGLTQSEAPIHVLPTEVLFLIQEMAYGEEVQKRALTFFSPIKKAEKKVESSEQSRTPASPSSPD